MKRRYTIALWIASALAIAWCVLVELLTRRAENPCGKCKHLDRCLSTCRARAEWDARQFR